MCKSPCSLFVQAQQAHNAAVLLQALNAEWMETHGLIATTGGCACSAQVATCPIVTLVQNCVVILHTAGIANAARVKRMRLCVLAYLGLSGNQSICEHDWCRCNVLDQVRTQCRVIPGVLTTQQKADIRACFDLMDLDGSGSLDADELVTAFGLLGIKVYQCS